jgi:hypothetical protein
VGSSFAEEAAEWPLATGANRTGVMTIADGLNVTAFAKIAIWPMKSASDSVPSSIMLTPSSCPVLRAPHSTVCQKGDHLSFTIMGIASLIGTMPPGMGYLERTRSPQLQQPSQERHHEFSKVKCALIETPVVLVSIKIAAVIVGIAAIKPIEPESTPKPFVAKMPTMEPTGELMKSSAAEGAAAKTTAEGACMQTASEATAMESTTMATTTASS